MDDMVLETTQRAPHQYVHRCTATSPSRDTYRFRSQRIAAAPVRATNQLRTHEPRIRHHGGHGRFPIHASGETATGTYASGGTATAGLHETANDAALQDLLISRSTKRRAGLIAHVEEATEEHTSGRAATHQHLTEIITSMTITERKNKLIDQYKKIRSETPNAFSTGQVSLHRVEVAQASRLQFSILCSTTLQARTPALSYAPEENNPLSLWERARVRESGKNVEKHN